MSPDTLSKIEVLKDPRLWLTAWLPLNQIFVTERGELKDKLGRHTGSLLDSCWLDYLSHSRAHKAAQAELPARQREQVQFFNDKDLGKALSEMLEIRGVEYKQKISQSLRCTTGENLAPLRAWTKAVTGNDSPVELAVMAHWLWLTKRKMLDMPVGNHIVPVLVGPQGGGKTVAISKLLEPIKAYQLNMKVNQLGDERYYISLSKNMVVFFDELAGATKVDAEVWKQQISADTNDVRLLNTQSVVKVRQACSFIAASNRNLIEQLADSTGARRFYQLNAMVKLDWATLNEIDYMALWTGVDESLSQGYIGTQLEAIRAAQQELVVTDDVDEFMIAHNLKSPAPGTEVLISTNKVYIWYQSWCNQFGHKPLNNAWLGRRLIGKGIHGKLVKDAADIPKRYYIINPECTIIGLTEVDPKKLLDFAPTKGRTNVVD